MAVVFSLGFVFFYYWRAAFDPNKGFYFEICLCFDNLRNFSISGRVGHNNLIINNTDIKVSIGIGSIFA